MIMIIIIDAPSYPLPSPPRSSACQRVHIQYIFICFKILSFKGLITMYGTAYYS